MTVAGGGIGGDAGAAKRYEQRWAPVVECVSLTRELVTEPANIIYPESFVEREFWNAAGLQERIERASELPLSQRHFPGGSYRRQLAIVASNDGWHNRESADLISAATVFARSRSGSCALPGAEAVMVSYGHTFALGCRDPRQG